MYGQQKSPGRFWRTGSCLSLSPRGGFLYCGRILAHPEKKTNPSRWSRLGQSNDGFSGLDKKKPAFHGLVTMLAVVG